MHPKSEHLQPVNLCPSAVCCHSGPKDLRGCSLSAPRGWATSCPEVVQPTVSTSWDLEVLYHWGKLTSCLSFALQRRCTQRLSEFLALAPCLPLRTGKTCRLPTQWSMRCRDLSPSCHMFHGAPLLTPTLKATSSPRYLLLSRWRGTCSTPVTHRAKCHKEWGSLKHRAFGGEEPVP